MFYENLTVDATFELFTDGYRIRVSDSFENNGKIENDGSDAVGTSGGDHRTDPTTNTPERVSGTIVGGTPGADIGSVPGNGVNGPTNSPHAGGASGAGGGAGIFSGGTAGAFYLLSDVGADLRGLPEAASLILTPTESGHETVDTLQISGGAGGGSGASNGGNPGAGGMGGGIVWIAAKSFANNGDISAIGGDGSPAIANAGGGGGGGGGAVVVISETALLSRGSGTVTVTGGAKGEGATGSDGVAGSVGSERQILHVGGSGTDAESFPSWCVATGRTVTVPDCRQYHIHEPMILEGTAAIVLSGSAKLTVRV